MTMITIRSLLALAFFCLVRLAAADITPCTLKTDDGPRTYLVAVPKGPAHPGRPLVLLLHGHTGSARQTLALGGPGHGSPLSVWLALADREGLVVAALDGAKGPDGQQGWNDGRPGGEGNPATDDVAFVRGVIDRLVLEQHVDPARVFLMGMSNGGVMALRLALALDRPLAAVAAACSTQPGDHAPAPPSRPVSVLLIEGTADPIMPYGGGEVAILGKKRGWVLGVEATLAFWREADHLQDPPAVQSLPHRGADPTHLTRRVWGPEGGPQVALLEVEGGGHAEPSLAKRYGWLYGKVAGAQNGDVESAEEAWAFFRNKRAAP